MRASEIDLFYGLDFSDKDEVDGAILRDRRMTSASRYCPKVCFLSSLIGSSLIGVTQLTMSAFVPTLMSLLHRKFPETIKAKLKGTIESMKSVCPALACPDRFTCRDRTSPLPNKRFALRLVWHAALAAFGCWRLSLGPGREVLSRDPYTDAASSLEESP